MRRRPGTIPLSQWLTSPNPVLREKAETLLYHLGPDAGEALLEAAEEESRYARQWRYLFFFPPQILIAVGLFYLIHLVCEVQAPLLWWLLGYLTLRSLWVLASDLLSRRNRLRTLALALAKRNDLRSIGPLIEVWRPIGPFGLTLRDDDVEHELNRLLPVFMRQNRLTLRNDKFHLLRLKVRRLYRQHRYAFQSDLSDDRTDLIVTLLQLMARTGGERNRALLQRLSHASAAHPNVQIVRESAQALQEIAERTLTAPTTPVTPTTHPTSSAARTTVTPSTNTPAPPLTLRRP